MEDLLAHLALVATDLDAVLCDDSLAGLTDAARVEVLQAAGMVLRRVGAVVVETVATSDPVGLAHGAGCRSANELLQRTLLVDAAAAARTVKAAGFTRRESSIVSGERLPARWPELRGALLDGAVGVAGLLAPVGPIERISDRIGADERLTADAFLADSAGGIDQADPDAVEDDDGVAVRDDVTGPGVIPEDLARLSLQIVTVLDPDGDEPDDQQALHRRGLVIGRLRQGLHRVTGHLLPDTAAQLQSILDAMLNPKVDAPPVPGASVRFEDSDMEDGASGGEGVGNGDGDDPFNSDPRAVIDPRTHAQKRHDALAAALGIAARHKEMPSLGGAAPTLVVTVDANDLARGAGRARLPGSEATIPVAAAEHVACTGAVQRVLLDGGGSSGSRRPTGSSRSTRGGRSSLATRNVSSRDVTFPRRGARSTMSSSTPTAVRPAPTTESRCAGGIIVRWARRGGRSVWTMACLRCAARRGGTPSVDGAHPHPPREGAPIFHRADPHYRADPSHRALARRRDTCAARSGGDRLPTCATDPVPWAI